MIYIIIFLLILLVGLLFLVIKKNSEKPKWKCTEDGCILDINGSYSSSEDCIKTCGDNHKVSFKPTPTFVANNK